MSAHPTTAELEELAVSALAGAAGETQATVVWQRVDGADDLAIELTTVIDGRAARARATGPDEASLGRAGHAAATNARRPRAWPTPGLPEPQEGRAHDGFDPAVLQDLGEPPAASGLEVTLSAGAARVAIASTLGVRASESRSWVTLTARGGTAEREVVVTASAAGPTALPAELLLHDAHALLCDGTVQEPLPAEELPVVLGHDAVATVLDHLRRAFGVDLDLGGSGPYAGRFGTRVAAAAVNLSDSPRHRSTLQRSFDAEGIPRRPVPLIQDGVAHRRVHDTASAARAGVASTGHATSAAALSPLPEQLVLVGGGAESLEELCGPVARGIYVPSFDARGEAAAGGTFVHDTRGALLIEDGRLTRPLADGPLVVDPAAVLAGVEALTMRQRTIALRGHTPGGPGAAVVPALRCSAGGVRPAAITA